MLSRYTHTRSALATQATSHTMLTHTPLSPRVSPRLSAHLYWLLNSQALCHRCHHQYTALRCRYTSSHAYANVVRVHRSSSIAGEEGETDFFLSPLLVLLSFKEDDYSHSALANGAPR